VAGEGGAREQALKLKVPIWGIGGRGAHRGGLVAATQVSGGNRRRQAGEDVESTGSGFVERR
jgi:hypothetical protein